MSNQSLRERLASTLADAAELQWDTLPDEAKPWHEHNENRGYWLEMADAAIHAFLVHFASNGLAIVPVEATRDMHAEWVLQSSWPNSWRALLKAAPPAAVLLKGTQAAQIRGKE